MGVPKGTDNFKSFRRARQDVSIELLTAELDKATKRKMRYPDKATLVSDMAERTNIHRTTLVRNPHYHRLLLAFLAAQAGGPTFVLDKDATPELLRAKLIDLQMEVSALRAQLKFLEKAKLGSSANDGLLRESLPTEHVAFVDTVWALIKVLERINLDVQVFEVDAEHCEILDLSAAPSMRVIASGKRLRPFLEARQRLQGQEAHQM